MGLGFNWFKKYAIEDFSDGFSFLNHNDYHVVLSDGDSTSHSYYNVSLIQELFDNITGKRIPQLPNDMCIDSKDYKISLIEPKEMSLMCDKVLAGNMVDDIDMRDRVNWFKQLSDLGFYLAYDWE